MELSPLNRLLLYINPGPHQLPIADHHYRVTEA